MNNKKEPQSNDLSDKLLKNLKETGFPIELRVGDIFLSRGITNLECNRYYIDEDELKGREIDICAYTNVHSEKPNLSVGLGLICEVKQSHKHPWIILTTKKGLIEGEGWLRLHYTTGGVDSSLLSYEQIERKCTTRQFARIGRTYHEGFKSDTAKSFIFEALTTACKAAEHWLKRQAEAAKTLQDKEISRVKESRLDAELRRITFVDPLIILDGPLYEAYLNDDGQIILDEIQNIPVSFGYISSKYNRYGYLVEVVTIQELPILLSRKLEWISDIHNSISVKLNK